MVKSKLMIKLDFVDESSNQVPIWTIKILDRHHRWKYTDNSDGDYCMQACFTMHGLMNVPAEGRGYLINPSFMGSHLSPYRNASFAESQFNIMYHVGIHAQQSTSTYIHVHIHTHGMLGTFTNQIFRLRQLAWTVRSPSTKWCPYLLPSSLAPGYATCQLIEW